MKFAEQLTDAMTAAGITMKKASDLLEIPYRTIQDWKNGLHEPNDFVKKTVLDNLGTYKERLELAELLVGSPAWDGSHDIDTVAAYDIDQLREAVSQLDEEEQAYFDDNGAYRTNDHEAQFNNTRMIDVFKVIHAEEIMTVAYCGDRATHYYHLADFEKGGKMERFANYSINRFGWDFNCRVWVG